MSAAARGKKRAAPPTPAATLGDRADLKQSDDEDDMALEAAPAMQEVVQGRMLTGAERAMRVFEDVANQKVPESTRNSSGGNTAAVEGVVLRTADIKVQGKSGMVPKLQCTIAVSKILGPGCKYLVTSGIDGIGFGLLSKTTEASPDVVARDPNAKGPTVLDIVDNNGRVAYMGMLTCSFYKEAPGSANAKDASSASGGQGNNKQIDLSAVKPGMRVLVSAVTFNYGSKDGSAGPIYCNARRITPLHKDVPIGETTTYLLAEATSPSAQASSAFLWSMAAHGFYGLEFNEKTSLKQQAEKCKGMWTTFRDGVASKLEHTALSMGADESAYGKATVGELTSLAERIKGFAPEEIAAGNTAILNCDLGKDQMTPYWGWLVQSGVRPGKKLTQMCAALWDPAASASLPPSFVEAKVNKFSRTGNLGIVDMRLYWVFDKAAAITAIDSGVFPLLNSTPAAARVKLALRSAAPELTGSLVATKVQMALQEVLPWCDIAAFANVYPRALDSPGLDDGHFIAPSSIDFRDGIRKVGVKVSIEFLNKEMLGNRGVYVHKLPDLPESDLIEPADGAKKPTLGRNAYQALSEEGFDIDDLSAPANMVNSYYVLYEGCANDVASKPSLCTSADEGEAQLRLVIDASDKYLDMRSFLRETAVIYAVAA